MTNGYNIIGDVAGQFDELMDLLDQMPADAEPISVGDMVDRGPHGLEVVDWFRHNGRAVMGNHEHMMLDFYRHKCATYGRGCWFDNGGRVTYNQLGMPVDPSWLDWVAALPERLELDGGNLVITHAPITPGLDLEGQVYGPWWNRSANVRRLGPGVVNVFGHNAHWGVLEFADKEGTYGMCVDGSRAGVAGVHWPSMEIFTSGDMEVRRIDVDGVS